MFLLIAVLVGLAVGFASGGSLAGFKTLRLRTLPLLFISLLIQVAIFTPIAGRYVFIHRIGPYIYIVMLLLALFFMLRNAHIPGMKIVALGAALNLLVIIANGGFMPSPESRLTEAGSIDKVRPPADVERPVLSNSKAVSDGSALIWDADAPLLALGDIFVIPEGWPLANVFSIGDTLIGLGACVVIVRAMHLRRDEPALAHGEAEDAAA